MIDPILLMLCITLATFLAMYWLDDSSAQAAVLPAMLLGIFLAPEGYRTTAGLCMATGFVGYLVMFFHERMVSAPMHAYGRPASPAVVEPRGVSSSPRTGSLPLTPTVLAPDGPYYGPQTQASSDIVAPGTPGEPMVFEGHVLRTTGEPVVGATVEIWQTHGDGDYDLTGTNCRGHQFTDENGAFRFNTVRPIGYGVASLSCIGILDFRAAHIHVKIRTDEKEITTGIFFADDPRCKQDVGYRMIGHKTVFDLEKTDEGLTARFDFVL